MKAAGWPVPGFALMQCRSHISRDSRTGSDPQQESRRADTAFSPPKSPAGVVKLQQGWICALESKPCCKRDGEGSSARQFPQRVSFPRALPTQGGIIIQCQTIMNEARSLTPGSFGRARNGNQDTPRQRMETPGAAAPYGIRQGDQQGTRDASQATLNTPFGKLWHSMSSWSK